MTGLILHTSNRLEILADMLAERLKVPAGGVLDEEIVVVQSRGMARWAAMALAERLGVCANVAFPFPDAAVSAIFQKVLPGVARQGIPFDRSHMTWQIMGLLDALIAKPGFEELGHYLGQEEGDLKRLQLSERISQVFDQYLMFRPDMILDWEAGKHDHWQARLWRRLAPNLPNSHRPVLGKAFIEATRGGDFDTQALPERISIFGVSALPPFHLDIFVRLSHFFSVYFFFMNPSMEYWGDIVSDWEYNRAIERHGGPEISIPELHLEKGNSLLASMGGLGRDFFDHLQESGSQEVQSFQDPGEQTLLSCLQSDILNLRERGGGPDGRRLISRQDHTVQIHSCHSPMREIEVLHDRLLDLVERNPHLLPKDILVMTPDIETYAPYIQAVFGTPESEITRFPFSVADRSARRESGLVDVFLAVLDLCFSRVTASEVMAILESGPICERFGLSEPDLQRIRRWIRESGIRWGIDEEFRSRFGLPSTRENTWQAGLDRLLLGYAMPETDDRMFQGILPYGAVEGGDTASLEGFVAFCHRLFGYVAAFQPARTLPEWVETLTEFVDAFLVCQGGDEAESRWLKDKLVALVQSDAESASGFDGKVDLAAVRWYLGRRLEETGFGHGFIGGGITFCTMLPMRSIPFKVVCLAGMNSDTFPRQSNPVGFDLMAKFPRRGDRSRRRDDRHLFLEAVLSAREVLYISHVGQSMRDNSVRPPSVLVSELIDYVQQGFVASQGEILDQVVTAHRLQPFNRAYFEPDGPNFSYSKTNAQVAKAAQDADAVTAPFFSQGLAEPGEEWKRVGLHDLSRFFANPAKFLLTERLRIELGQEEVTLADEEVFHLSGLERYWLEQDLADRGVAGEPLHSAMAARRSAGRLPHGTVGECVYKQACRQVADFVDKTRPYLCDPAPEPWDVAIHLSGLALVGRLDRIYGGRLVYWRYAALKARDWLRAWIYHLAAQCADTGLSKPTILIGLAEKKKQRQQTGVQFGAVRDPKGTLEGLLEIYQAGLTQAIPFFPETSWAYARRFLNDSTGSNAALKAADRVWRGSRHSRGEGEDPYYRLCFGGVDPLDGVFEDLAIAVFEPLLRYCRDLGAEDGAMG